MPDEIFDNEYYTLTDEDGVESEYELIGSLDVDGQTYVALIPVEENDDDSDEANYVILKVAKENGEEIFETIEDDEEFDRVADIFEDEIFSEFDYDEDVEAEEE